MDKEKLIMQIIEYVKPIYAKCDDEVPDIWNTHIRLCRKYAQVLADIEGADSDVLDIAVLFHDIGRAFVKDIHAKISRDMAEDFFKGHPVDNEELILQCIEKHGSGYIDPNNLIEVKIIQCADAISTFFDPYILEKWDSLSMDDLCKKLDKLERKISLDSAKKIAEPKLKMFRAKCRR